MVDGGIGVGMVLVGLGVGVPVGLAISLLRFAFRDQVEAGLTAALAGLYTVDVFLRLPWHWIGHPLRWGVLILGSVAVGLALWRLPRLPIWVGVGSLRRLGSLLLMAGMIPIVGALVGMDVRGRWVPRESVVDLHFPLSSGFYAVAHGGRGVLLNAHAPSPEQRYALDIVKLNPLGLRAWGLLPASLERYAIYGDPVVAPCEGTVVEAVDGIEDRTPSLTVRDTQNPAGNHVVLACAHAGRTVHVVLAHLQRGSVRVIPGDRVAVGKVLGKVGNSGNTSEPHLHIHAVDPVTRRGLPIRFGGRFLVRNQVVYVPAHGR